VTMVRYYCLMCWPYRFARERRRTVLRRAKISKSTLYRTLARLYLFAGSTEPGMSTGYLNAALAFSYLQPIRRIFQMRRLASFITMLLNTAQAETDYGRLLSRFLLVIS
jgi:hypothetical protein